MQHQKQCSIHDAVNVPQVSCTTGFSALSGESPGKYSTQLHLVLYTPLNLPLTLCCTHLSTCPSPCAVYTSQPAPHLVLYTPLNLPLTLCCIHLSTCPSCNKPCSVLEHGTLTSKYQVVCQSVGERVRNKCSHKLVSMKQLFVWWQILSE